MSIMDMMQQIQATHFERDKASAFVRDLKCLRLKHLGDTIKFKTAQIDVFDEDCAIASWSWKRSKHEDSSVGRCLIEDDKGESRRSKVRDSVWRRAAAFMRYTGVQYLWIDRECIAQDNSEEQKTAMGEMDLLYQRGKPPFGMLTRPLKKETELHLLAQILQGKLACQSRHKREFPLKKGIAIASAREAIQLLDEITSDTWWTRAWIYQENYRGGEKMLLLMPHDSTLERSKAKYGELFGDLEGELIIDSIPFCKAVTEVCSTFITWSTSHEPQKLEEAAHRILSRAGRYSVLLEERSSMSPTVIADIVKRGVTNHSDRLAIIANCCSYNRRINSTMLKKEGLSVSLAILVLFLLNGEIFHYEPEIPWNMASSDFKIVDFIQNHAFDRFSPPFAEKWLTFNKRCRFADVSLEADGVHTLGHLWKVWRRAIRISPQEIKNWGTVEETLWGLHGYIEALPSQERLACKMKEFLMMFTQSPESPGSPWSPASPESSESPASPEHKYMWDMAVKLANALQDGSTLRLGYLANSSRPGRVEPMGIFICPDETMPKRPGSVYVFTSWKKRKTSDESAYPSDVDKHVSLRVKVEHDGGLPPKLFAGEWIHGLWFCEEEPKSVVFPLPRILSEL